MRYTKTQALYLSRKGVLPEIVDIFGMGKDDSTTDADDIWASGSADDEPAQKAPSADKASEDAASSADDSSESGDES
jgi:hypothetical protein